MDSPKDTDANVWCQLGIGWIGHHGTEGLDALQGLRWTTHRDACRPCAQLPDWHLPDDPLLPHLAEQTILELAGQTLPADTPEETRLWLDAHLLECHDCQATMHDTREDLADSGSRAETPWHPGDVHKRVLATGRVHGVPYGPELGFAWTDPDVGEWRCMLGLDPHEIRAEFIVPKRAKWSKLLVELDLTEDEWLVLEFTPSQVRTHVPPIEAAIRPTPVDARFTVVGPPTGRPDFARLVEAADSPHIITPMLAANPQPAGKLIAFPTRAKQWVMPIAAAVVLGITGLLTHSLLRSPEDGGSGSPSRDWIVRGAAPRALLGFYAAEGRVRRCAAKDSQITPCVWHVKKEELGVYYALSPDSGFNALLIVGVTEAGKILHIYPDSADGLVESSGPIGPTVGRNCPDGLCQLPNAGGQFEGSELPAESFEVLAIFSAQPIDMPTLQSRLQRDKDGRRVFAPHQTESMHQFTVIGR